MSDRILINGLEVMAHIGVPDEERSQPQKLRLSVELKTASLVAAAQTDDVDLTVDYDAVAQLIRRVAQERPRRLIETLAEDIAKAILRDFAVKEIRVRVDKFIFADAESVSVEIKRPRK
jgi:dihydroneopterin aldolase